MDLSHWRAGGPSEGIAGFCPCALVLGGKGCMKRPRARRSRARSSRRRRARTTTRDKSNDPDGPSSPPHHPSPFTRSHNREPENAMTRSPNNPACDRASVLATAVMQIAASKTLTQYELRRRLNEYQRDEIQDLAQQIANERENS